MKPARLVMVLCAALAACGKDDANDTPCPTVALSGDGVIDNEVATIRTKLFTRGDTLPTTTTATSFYAERSDSSHLPGTLGVCPSATTPTPLFARFWGYGSDGGLIAASADMLSIDLTAAVTVDKQLSAAGINEADMADATDQTIYVQSTLSNLCFAGPATLGADIVQDQCRVGTAHLYERSNFRGLDGSSLTQLRLSGTNLCLEIAGASRALRAHATLGECVAGPIDNAPQQVIILRDDGSLTMLDSKQCLTTENSSLSAGAVIQQFTCSSVYNNQYFRASWSLGALPQ